MSAIEQLVTLHENIKEAWQLLEDREPSLTVELRELLSQVDGAENEAKMELRSLGPGTHEFGDQAFKVRPGGSKVVFDTEDVIIEAELNGHVEMLLEADFLKYSVNGAQLDRLPADIRAVYADMATEKVGSARVYMPKDLCK